MKFFLALLALTAVGIEARPQIGTFQQFKTHFGKQYNSVQEELARESSFLENLQFIEQFNLKNDDLKLEINDFSDLSPEEYRNRFNNIHLEESLGKFPSLDNGVPDVEVDVASLPHEVDWRSIGNKIRHQGGCGACWAFGTLAAIEYAHAIHKKVSPDHLSTQELVDCASNSRYLNMGCSFGLTDQAYDYIVDNGIYQDKFYSYTQKKGECHNETATMKTHPKLHISGYEIIPGGSNDSVIMDVLAKHGPVTTAMDVNSPLFHHYKSGILKNLSKGAIFVNHVLAIVGYTTINNTDVWIVRNSWGESWGYDGYAYIERGYNQMGINNYNVYPVL